MITPHPISPDVYPRSNIPNIKKSVSFDFLKPEVGWKNEVYSVAEFF